MLGKYYDLMFPVGCNKLCSAWNKIVAAFMNLKYPGWCEKNKNTRALNKMQREKILVSLTSFPARFDNLHLTIDSIFHQTVKPNRIILWLAKEECEGVKLPASLEEMKAYGLEIKFANENLKPHMKYIYSAAEYPEYIIITVDDDVLYDDRMIERLIEGYSEHKNCVICNMAHKIVLNKNGMPDLYSRWDGGAIGETGPSHKLTALGVGGVLYPPCLFDPLYFNTELIKKLSLTADDLWLKYNEVRLGIQVYKIDKNAKNPVTIRNSQSQSLTSINNGKSVNNVVINNLNRYFNINWGGYYRRVVRTIAIDYMNRLYLSYGIAKGGNLCF